MPENEDKEIMQMAEAFAKLAQVYMEALKIMNEEVPTPQQAVLIVMNSVIKGKTPIKSEPDISEMMKNLRYEGK